jgi:hypothetical protein
VEPLDELFSLLRRDRRAVPPSTTAAPAGGTVPDPERAPAAAPQPGFAGDEPGIPTASGWTTVSTRREIRLEVAGELSIAQQRQLELIADLIHEIVTPSG